MSGIREPMSDQRFTRLAFLMRTAQKSFFKTKDPAYLAEAKELEREFDEEIALRQHHGGLFAGVNK